MSCGLCSASTWTTTRLHTPPELEHRMFLLQREGDEIRPCEKRATAINLVLCTTTQLVSCCVCANVVILAHSLAIETAMNDAAATCCRLVYNSGALTSSHSSIWRRRMNDVRVRRLMSENKTMVGPAELVVSCRGPRGWADRRSRVTNCACRRREPTFFVDALKRKSAQCVRKLVHQHFCYCGFGRTTRWSSQVKCEPGHYCVDGVRFPCPPGYFGSSPGLTTPTCSGSCAAGMYPEAGTAGGAWVGTVPAISWGEALIAVRPRRATLSASRIFVVPTASVFGDEIGTLLLINTVSRDVRRLHQTQEEAAAFLCLFGYVLRGVQAGCQDCASHVPLVHQTPLLLGTRSLVYKGRTRARFTLLRLYPKCNIFVSIVLFAGYLCGSRATSPTEMVCGGGGDGDLFCPEGSSAASKVGGLGEGPREAILSRAPSPDHNFKSLVLTGAVWYGTAFAWSSPWFLRRRCQEVTVRY